LNELATVRYSIEKVVAMTEAKNPVGEESILLLVHCGLVIGSISKSDGRMLTGGLNGFSEGAASWGRQTLGIYQERLFCTACALKLLLRI